MGSQPAHEGLRGEHELAGRQYGTPVGACLFERDRLAGERRVIGLSSQRNQWGTVDVELPCDGLRLVAARAGDGYAALPGERVHGLPAGGDALPRVAVPAQAGQGDGLECEDQQTDQQRYPYRAAVDGDFRRDASDGAPDGCRRLIGGILAGQRRFAVCLLLVAQRVGERHGRLSDQRLRLGGVRFWLSSGIFVSLGVG